MSWSGWGDDTVTSQTTKEWFRTSQNEKWSHETADKYNGIKKAMCVWYVLILCILAKGCKSFSHLRWSDSPTALSNLIPSLVLSWSQDLGKVSPFSEKGAPTPTVLEAFLGLDHTPSMCHSLKVRFQRCECRFIYLWLPLTPGAGVSYKVLICTVSEFLNNRKERNFHGRWDLSWN